MTPFTALGTVVREKRPKTSLTEEVEEQNEEELNNSVREATHHSLKQVQLPPIGTNEGLESCLEGENQKVDSLEDQGENGIQDARDISTTPCEESQFFTCPNSDPIPVNSKVTDPISNPEGDVCDEATEEPRQKRVRRSTECTDLSLDFATAPQPPESDLTTSPQPPELDISQLAAKAAMEVMESTVKEMDKSDAVNLQGISRNSKSGQKRSETTERMRLLAIVCDPPARFKRVTTGQLCTAPPGSYRLLAVVVKAALEEDECSEPKVTLDVKDAESEVMLTVNEKEVEQMCRDSLVRHSLSVEQGLAELEGKVVDLGVEKTADGLYVVHSKMI